MNKIKEWLLKFNPDNPVWCLAVKEADTYDQLESLINPIASEIGWLHLKELGELIHE
jgi:hypothetical protein